MRLLPFTALTALLFSGWNFATAQGGHKYLLKGDQAYKRNDFETAELQYRRALEKENATQGTYNLGNSTYRQERYDEAISHYEAAAESAKEDATKARAFHNLGNAHFQAGKYKESAEAYKNALRLHPSDVGTKQNLLRAIRKMPPPPPPSQQPQQGDQQNEKEQEQQNQQQQNQQDQPQKEQEQEDPSQQPNQQQDPSQPSKQQQEKQPRNMSKEEAGKLLEIMDQEEQRVQEKMRKAGAKKVQVKDW